jgi:hypothetical protein
MARRGFAAADARRRTGAPPRSAAYPAEAALHCLHAALRASDSATLRYWAAVAVGFLISARPSSIAGLTPDAVRLSPHAVLIELRVFKYGTSGHAPRVSLHIPTAGEPDPIRRLFRALLAGSRLPGAPWFTLRDLSAAAAAGLRAVAAIAPPRRPIYPAVPPERGHHCRLRGRRSYGTHYAREQSRVYGRRPSALFGRSRAADARCTGVL